VRPSHADKVQRIAAELRGRAGKEPVVLRKKGVSHQVPKARDPKYGRPHIDVSDLDQILDVDVAHRRCVAESGVTFFDLVKATLPHGLVPAVVPELKTITVGGAVSGCSIESASFIYGGFHDTCLEYEVITARGEVLRCQPDGENALLFQMMHGTFGTLGILSQLTFALVPAKPLVHMTYTKHGDIASFQADVERHYRLRDVDFMDAIIHSRTAWVLCTGVFVEDAPYTSRYDWTKVYYESTGRLNEDYLETVDYFFRYDRGVTNVHPRSFLGRLFLGKLFGSTRLLGLAEKLNRWLPAKDPDVILDMFLPFSQAPRFMSWFEETFDFFPLWCVPYKRVRDYAWLAPSFYAELEDELFLDFAVYGMKQKPGQNAYRVIEDALPRFRGLKTLISHNDYSEDAFWRIWNKSNYDEVKAKTDPDDVFLDLYEKTCGQYQRAR
jgi:FAD/FMN-containing dehydrogenase